MVGPAHLEFGYVARAHGLQGEVLVRLFDPGSEAPYEVERVQLRTRDGRTLALALDEVRSATDGALMFFEGVETREQAEALVGSTVLAFREDLTAPLEGEYFLGDLVGLTAIDESGAELGKVEEVWSHLPVPNLVIRQTKALGEPVELIVPFVDDYVPQVDLAAGRVVVRPLEYLE